VVEMLPDEKQGRPGDDIETANQKTSHGQATSSTDSSHEHAFEVRFADAAIASGPQP
jgi:hypothetical protein